MSAGNFNPYHEWLGLDRSVVQPNFYQLLSLAEGERDSQRILGAAQRALTRVRSARPGGRTAVWSQVLDEIDQARVCLVDANRRAEYDRQLRAGGTRDPRNFARPAPRGPATYQAGFASSAVPVQGSPTPHPSYQHQSLASPPSGGSADPMAPVVPSVPMRSRPAVSGTAPTQTMSSHGSVGNPGLALPMGRPLPGRVTGPVGSPIATGSPVARVASSPVVQPNGGGSLASSRRGSRRSANPVTLMLLGLGCLIVAMLLVLVVVLVLRRDSDKTATPKRSLAESRLPRWTAADPPPAIRPRSDARGVPTGRQEPRTPNRNSRVAATYVRESERAEAVAEERLAAEPLPSLPTIPPLGELPGENNTLINAAAAVPGSVDPSAGSGNAPEGPSHEGSMDAPTTSGTTPPDTAEGRSDPPESTPADAEEAASTATDPVSTEPTETPTPPEPTDEQVAAWRATMREARQAIADGQFPQALDNLEAIDSLPMGEEARAQYDRLNLLAHYAQQFQGAVAQAMERLTGGDTIPVGNNSAVGVVKAARDSITLRVRGTNLRYDVDQLPPGLAIAIADTWLDSADPVSLLVKAAYLAALPDRREDRVQKARELFAEAAKKGISEARDLPRVLDDTYDP